VSTVVLYWREKIYWISSGDKLYKKGVLEEIEEINENVRLFKIRHKISADPGQYILIWAPRIGEAPFSISDLYEDVFELLIAKKGKVTGYLFERKPNDIIRFRGPYGRGFSIVKGRAMLIGGGYGVAPFPLLMRRLKEVGSRVDVFLGFKDRGSAIKLKTLESMAEKIVITTEDGSIGVKGVITDVIPDSGYDLAYVCGKERMAYEILRKIKIDAEVSLERIMRCGLGICGSCALNGFRVCVDGPVFRGKDLMISDEFGKFWRGMNGRKEPI